VVLNFKTIKLINDSKSVIFMNKINKNPIKIESELKFKLPFLYSEYTNFNDIDINLIYKGVQKNSKGVDFTGFIRSVNGYATGLAITGILNYSKRSNDFLIQCGFLLNIVEYKKETDFILQIGAVNKVENNYYPFVSINGLKNLPGLIKKILQK